MLAQTALKEEFEQLANDKDYVEKLKKETNELLQGKVPASMKETVSVVKADGTRELWQL